MLGARWGTAHKLVASGRVRAVEWGRRRRVIVEDLRRAVEEGISVDGRRPRAASRRRKAQAAADLAASIMAIDISKAPDDR